MSLIIAAVIGVLAGTHIATWGMYKDAPHEGFELRKYLRSILVGATIAPVLVLAGYPLGSIGSMIVLFGVTYVLERAACEFYKTFLREEDQAKYTIPMQLAVFGKVVQSRSTRLKAGIGTVAAASVLLAGVFALQLASGPHPPLVALLAAGSLGGWFSAVGGAWKDAPHEGFETFKFFRSPVLATLYALLLSLFTDQLVLLGLAGLGFTVATLETYKTFCFPSKPRGKFAGKPVLFPHMLARRGWFVPLYASIWMLLLAAAATAVAGL